jgi:lipopolysaccharide export LptBFGC system permease protein LptF
MRNTLYLLICLILFGCELSSEELNENIKSEKTKTEYIDTPDELIGFWVNEEYLNALKQTRSTKKSSEMGVDDFYKISDNNSVMRLNLHEGGANNIILMTSKSNGQIFSADTTESYFKIELNNMYLVIDNRKYIKSPVGLKEMVNNTLFVGNYMIDNKPVQLEENGKVIGLDSIVYYEANLDYADAGMQHDKIYLKFKNEKERRIYLYEFVSDTLKIFNVDCLTMDEESDYCLEVEKGKEFLRLIKK